MDATDTINEVQNIERGLKEVDADLGELERAVTNEGQNIATMLSNAISAISGAIAEVPARRKAVDALTYALGVVIATDKGLRARHGAIFNTPDHPKPDHIERRQKIKNDILALASDCAKIEEFNDNFKSRLTRLEERN
jgi:hypothetical protein